MRIARGSSISLLVLAIPLAACGDDSGGGGSGGSGDGGATSTSTATTTTTATATTTTTATTSTTATTTATTSTTGDGGAGGGGGSEDVGSGGYGGSADLACADTDIDEEDLGLLDEDPEAGDFTLDEALDGLPEGDGPLRAIIDTDLGDMTCELFPDVAPIGVANFVGLARGRRAFVDPETDHWVRGRRFYDGLTFHRVLDDFVIQGGDPLGNGYGGPGYEFVDETDGGESHTPGTLSYANAGPDTNGSQFFIVTEEPATFLDGDYTIFGRCEPLGVIDEISEVPLTGNPDDGTPADPVIMNRVHITRCAPAD